MILLDQRGIITHLCHYHIVYHILFVILQHCFTATGADVLLPKCQGSKPKGYG